LPTSYRPSASSTREGALPIETEAESILLFPTFGVTVEHALRHDVEASFGAFSALAWRGSEA
jgi:hypothetical protein